MPHKTSLPNSFSSARRLLRRDKRWLNFGFFLLVSFSMWTLRKLSDSYVYELPAQIELTTPKPDGYIISPQEATRVQLRVEASGTDLMHYRLFKRKKFKVRLPQTEGRSAIATAQLRGALAQALGSNYELLSISPDSISVHLSRVAVKKVPVRSNIRISYAPQYMQRGATQLTPDSVIISGAENAVSKIDEIFTEPLVKEKVSEDLSGKLNLILPPQVFLSPTKISYDIDIQRVTEISYELPIHVENAPDTLNVSVLPATAKVIFSVTMEEFSRLKREELYLMVRYGELRQSLSDQLRVQLSNPPAYVLSTSISPAFVNVISMRKP